MESMESSWAKPKIGLNHMQEEKPQLGIIEKVQTAQSGLTEMQVEKPKSGIKEVKVKRTWEPPASRSVQLGTDQMKRGTRGKTTEI